MMAKTTHPWMDDVDVRAIELERGIIYRHVFLGSKRKRWTLDRGDVLA